MSATPQGRACQGCGVSGVSSVASRGRHQGQRGAPRARGTRLSAPQTGLLMGEPGEIPVGEPGITSIACEGKPRRTGSVRGPSNKELKLTPSRPGWGARARPGGG